MTAAEKLAALRALREGLNAAIEDAAAEVEGVRETTGSKSFDTRYGLVGFSIHPTTYLFDEAAFLAWTEENAPESLIPAWTEVKEWPARPSDTLRAAMGKRCVQIGDDVFDSLTGDVLPFATARPGKETLTVKLNPATKLEAADLVRDRISDVVGIMQIEGS